VLISACGRLQRHRKHEVELPAKLVADTMAEAHGAACELLEHLYEVLTGKK
jgi:hypothetical protein